jgi:hypothetical protein
MTSKQLIALCSIALSLALLTGCGGSGGCKSCDPSTENVKVQGFTPESKRVSGAMPAEATEPVAEDTDSDDLAKLLEVENLLHELDDEVTEFENEEERKSGPMPDKNIKELGGF